MVFRAIFGPGCARPARAWSDAYVQLQVWLAQTAGSPVTETQVAEAPRDEQVSALMDEDQQHKSHGKHPTPGQTDVGNALNSPL